MDYEDGSGFSGMEVMLPNYTTTAVAPPVEEGEDEERLGEIQNSCSKKYVTGVMRLRADITLSFSTFNI